MSRQHVKRRWFKPWKVEYWWYSSAYGTVVGYAWTRRTAWNRLGRAVFEMVNDV